jgi:cytochrome bd-type quinol oxidase subunit 2
MKKKISKVIIVLATMLTGFTLLAQNLALAIDCATCSGASNLTTQQAIECGSSCASGNNQTSDKAESNVNGTIKDLINILSVAVGVAAVIMIVIGGFRYVTSGGKQESVTSAKNTIMYALIGLVVVALAQIIVRFVLTRVTHPIT